MGSMDDAATAINTLIVALDRAQKQFTATQASINTARHELLRDLGTTTHTRIRHAAQATINATQYLAEATNHLKSAVDIARDLAAELGLDQPNQLKRDDLLPTRTKHASPPSQARPHPVHSTNGPCPTAGFQAADAAPSTFERPGGMSGALFTPGRAPLNLSSGSRNLHPRYLENLPPGTNSTNYHHLEAQSAGYMRLTGSTESHLFITGEYICGACTDRLKAMLPEGANLTVWLRNAEGIQSRAFTGLPD